MKRYLKIFKNHGKSLLLLLVFTLICSVFSIGMTYIGGMYIDIVVEAKDMSNIYRVCIILFVITCVSLIAKYGITYQSGTVTETLIYHLKKRVLEHLKKISVIEYNKYNISYLAKRIDEDSRQIVRFIMNCFSSTFVKTIEIMAIFMIVFSLNIYIGIVMFMLCPMYFFLYKKFRNSIYQKNLVVKEREAELFQGIANQLEYMEDILIEADFEREESILDSYYNSYFKSYKGFIGTNVRFTFCQGILVCVMQIIIFLVGGYSVLQGYTSIGNLSILMSYFMQILSNITYYIEIGKEYQIAKTSIHRMNMLLDLEVVEDGKGEINEIDNIQADLTFKIDDKKILSQLKVEASRGEVIGVVGENGSGKTTMIKLLIGLYRNNDECMIIYNGDSSLNSLNSLTFRRKYLSYVSQKIRFRDISIHETLNEVKKLESSDELIKLLEEKGIPVTEALKSFFYNNWEVKVNTLSGGDKQLIAIIRSILKEKPIVVFDEPTSNLDCNRCLWFYDMISNLKKSNIIFVITHDQRGTYTFDRVINL